MAYAKIHNVLIHHEMYIFEKTSSESDKKKKHSNEDTGPDWKYGNMDLL